MSQSPDLSAVLAECRTFVEHFQSLHLATCNAAGEPEASYAAYLAHEGSYYVYTSELSRHTANLAESGRCAVLFIESEAEAKHLFARRRLSLQCEAIECPRDTPAFEGLMDLFEQKFGHFMAMMRGLSDFHLFALRPVSGGYVNGFARAYSLSGVGLSEISHRNEAGHRSPKERPMHDSVQTIRNSFTTLRHNGKARHRDIAEQLSISEAALIAAHADAPQDDPHVILHATRLRSDWPDIINAVEQLGEVMALTRNASCVHEKTGVYRNASHNNHVGLVLGREIDLRMFYQQWRHGFGVVEQTEQGLQRSLQFFDAEGTAIHKIFLKSQSDVAAYTGLVARFAASDQSPAIHVQAAKTQLPEFADSAIDIAGFHKAWDSLRDTHDFHGLLKNFGVTRTQALRLAEPKYVQQVEVEDCQTLLQAAAAEGVSIMVFVGNSGVIQIHSGPVKKVAVMGPWINVLDPGFNLHLREDHIHSVWVVKKPTVDGLVTSLELFDAQGNTIAMFFGERKPGARELGGWRALIENIQQEPRTCAA